MRKIIDLTFIMALICAALLTAGCCCCTGCDVTGLMPTSTPTATPTPTPTPTVNPTTTPVVTAKPSPTPTPKPTSTPDEVIIGTWSDSRSMSIMVFYNDYGWRWQASSLYLGTWKKLSENTYQVTFTDTDGTTRVENILYNPNAKTIYFEDTPWGMFTKSV